MQMHASTRRKSSELRDWPLVAWWIRITSPAPDSPRYGRNPQWREEVTSLLFPIVLLLVLLPIPAALSNPAQLIIICIVFCIDVGALFLKRAGMIHIAGIILTITIEFRTVLSHTSHWSFGWSEFAHSRPTLAIEYRGNSFLPSNSCLPNCFLELLYRSRCPKLSATYTSP